MSVTKFSSKDISRLAWFAQNVGIGSAALVGDLIFQQNLKAVNYRYSENNHEEFVLSEAEKQESCEAIFDFADYVKSNSYTEDFESSKGYHLLNEIIRSSAWPIDGEETFDELIGKPVRLKGIYQTTGYITKKNGDLISVVYFDSSKEQWLTGQPSPLVWGWSESDIQLSVEQTREMVKHIEERTEREYQQRMVELEKQREAEQEFKKEFEQKKPANAKAYIVAELWHDESSSMDDYYGGRCVRRVILAWSTHTRNLFPEFRKVARNYSETEFLSKSGKDAEHRENYSMGGGTYLTEGSRYSGWQIRKKSIGSYGCDFAEWSLPEPIEVKVAKANAHKETGQKLTNYTTNEKKLLLANNGHSIFKNSERNNIEIHSDEKPSKDFLSALKAGGFRYFAQEKFWYSTFTEDAIVLARSLVYPQGLAGTIL